MNYENDSEAAINHLFRKKGSSIFNVTNMYNLHQINAFSYDNDGRNILFFVKIFDLLVLGY